MHSKIIIRYVFLAILIIPFNLLSMGQIKYVSINLMVGDMKVRMLQDAQIYLPISYLSGIENKDALKLAGGMDSVWTPVNAFLVQTPTQVVLVDAGIGKSPGEDAGHLIEQLKNAGIEPADVDLILITHFHFDHIGGLTSPEGKRIFPNAIVRASQKESDFWLRDSSLIPVNLRERAAKIKAILNPYISAKSYLPFSPNDELGDGIKAFPAYGHTPGHTVFTFTSKGKELWCIGDLIHFGNIQFKYPSVGVVFDSDSPMAIKARIDFFQRAAMTQAILAGGHLPELVKIKKTGEAFVATPVDTR
jgi:glyoxylase-like metal-dependent hydrolase (beta-lactamase superfamily II)